MTCAIFRSLEGSHQAQATLAGTMFQAAVTARRQECWGSSEAVPPVTFVTVTIGMHYFPVLSFTSLE